MSAEKKQKKLLLLGGLRYLLPIIDAAHRMNCHVITCDYLPNNIAHKYSDEYYNLNILDKEAVLQLATELEIDGIMSFAVDPGVVTAAYVAEKLNLPFQGSFESVSILQDKSKFRAFLTKHGFNVPKAKGYTNISDAISDVEFFNWPVIVKPVDSAGSKGVSRVDTPNDLQNAIEYALSESHNGHFIIEDFLEKDGHSSDSESFTINGNLVFCSFSDQRFDNKAENPYTPAAFSWPSTMVSSAQKELTSELQRLMNLLNMRTGIYNVETRLCKNGKPYIMEVSPRGGGNRLAEMLDYATNTSLITQSVKAALGENPENISMPNYNGFLAEVILHADHCGNFQRVELNSNLKATIVEKDLWVKEGAAVNGFTGANNAIGTLVLRFENAETMNEALSNIEKWCKVIVE